MESIKVSIIVPVYNVEKYLSKCIESIINQTYNNLEIILVDDGSPDNCGKICDEYALKDERIIVVHQSNGGLSVARNSGLDIANGDYVIFVDSDDWIENNLIEECLNAIRTDDADIVIFNWFIATAMSKITKEVNHMYVRDTNEAFNAILYDSMPSYAWNKFYNKKLWDGLRYTIGINFEDLAVMPLVFSKVHSICYLDKALYCYNVENSSSITKNLSAKNKYGLFYAFKIRQEIAIDKNMPELYDCSRKRALRSAVTAYGLNTQEKVLFEEQVDCIKKYVLFEKKDKGLSGIGLKYQMLAYGVMHCEAICKFYGSCMFFFEKIRKIIKY